MYYTCPHAFMDMIMMSDLHIHYPVKQGPLGPLGTIGSTMMMAIFGHPLEGIPQDPHCHLPLSGLLRKWYCVIEEPTANSKVKDRDQLPYHFSLSSVESMNQVIKDLRSESKLGRDAIRRIPYKGSEYFC